MSESTKRSDDKRQRSGDKAGSKKGAFFKELVILVVLVLGLTALLRGLVFEAYMIPSGSMENTLRIGDKVLVNKLVYRFGDVERGDVIVFDGAGSFTPEVRTPPDDQANPVVRVFRWISQFFGGTPIGEEDFVKRVIGVPGDKVECRRSDTGFGMYVNGVRLQEKAYLYPGDQPCAKEFAGKNAVTVPQGRLWVMGDHRSLSADSREHVDDGNLGTVPEDAVIGKAFAIVWPTDHWTSLARPDTFDQRALHGAAQPTGVVGVDGGPVPLAALAAGLVLAPGRTRRWRPRRP